MTFLGYSDSPRGELHQPTWVMTQMGDINSVRTELTTPLDASQCAIDTDQ
jgi:hypothetical protein